MRWSYLIALTAFAAVSDAHIKFGNVPVYNFEASLFSGQEESQTWIVSIKSNVHNDVLKALCEEASKCIASGHPDEGGMSFITIEAKPSEVEALALKHGKEYMFIEPAMEVRISDDWNPDHDYNRQDFEMPPMNASFLQTLEETPLWGLDRIDDEKGMDGTYTPPKKYNGGKGAHVYVLDTGMQINHQEFEDRAINLLDALSGSVTLCNSGNNDVCGNDDVGHGTHCAGTVGGARTGVAPKSTLYNVKVLGAAGGTTAGIVAAMDYIIANQEPGILSMSLGGYGRSSFMQNAVDRVVGAGFAVIVAAGNYDANSCEYQPAFVPNAFNVGATDPADERAVFSNWGTCNDIFAPGVGIGSAFPGVDEDGKPDSSINNLYTKMDGTSMACPHVSGAAALLLSEKPDMTPFDVTQKLIGMAHKGLVDSATIKESPNLLLHIGSAPATKPTDKPSGGSECPKCEKCPEKPKESTRRRSGKSRRRRRRNRKTAL
jgi:hypothetical protein